MLDILLEATLRATLIAAAALFALPLFRVRAADVRHRVWTVVLLAMLLLPFWIAWAPEIALRVLPPTHLSASNAVAPLALGAPAGDTTAPMWPGVEQAAAGGAADRTPDSQAVERTVERWNWRRWLVAIYLAGAGALLLRLAIGTVRVRALASGARVVNGQLTSARIATPFTVGVLRPRILLPEGWDRWPAARLAAVLDHERAHVDRRDPIVQWLALLNRALFWFHPLAWWLERRLAALAEGACDAAVLARGHAPAAYSEHLLDLARIARRRPMPHVVGMAMPGSMLPARIAKILDGSVARPGSRAAVAGAAALATLGAVALGAITLAQEVAAPSLTPAADSFTPLPEHWHGDDEWRLEVAPLMTPEETDAYRALRSMEERDRFIGAFWLRRDPTPGTIHNERKKEYERRIHYADQSFRDPDGPGSFGYQTNRGAAYVLLGEPDSIDSVAEDGQPYEIWRYSDVNGTGEAFAVRVALSPRIACGPAYEIVEPGPSETFLGSTSLGGNAPGPLAVRVYPLGLVTFAIPVEYGSVQRVRATVERGDGAPVQSHWEFHLAPMGLPPGKRGITVFGQEGLNCTLPMPPGDYRLTAEVDLFSGEHLTDSVAFDVNTL
jgi:GWxTD domain-containing protein